MSGDSKNWIETVTKKEPDFIESVNSVFDVGYKKAVELFGNIKTSEGRDAVGRALLNPISSNILSSIGTNNNKDYGTSNLQDAAALITINQKFEVGNAIKSLEEKIVQSFKFHTSRTEKQPAMDTIRTNVEEMFSAMKDKARRLYPNKRQIDD